MEWAAKMLGLDEKFLNTSLVGGGVIQVTKSDVPFPLGRLKTDDIL